jgi:rusticyanin
MQRNRIIAAALLGGLTVGAASTGYVIAQITSNSGRNFTSTGFSGPSPTPGSSSTAGSSSMSASPSASAGGMNSNANAALGHFIGEKAGTRLAGQAPEYVPVSQVPALGNQVPAGASIDHGTNTITFTGTTVSFTVVSIGPGCPDMTFRVAGLCSPTIIVPKGAQLTVRFINNDATEAHGWIVVGKQPPYDFDPKAPVAMPAAKAGVIGDPTSAGDGANTVTFTASSTGNYRYICPIPGHAEMGMYGVFIVR